MFAIETIHPTGVVEDQSDEAQDRALLSKPEAQAEAKKSDLIERLRQDDAEAEGDRKPDREARDDEAEIRTPVACPGFSSCHIAIPRLIAVVLKIVTAKFQHRSRRAESRNGCQHPLD